MPLKNYAFKTSFKPYRKLVILEQEINDKVIKSISPLNAELDYPDLTTFNIGNVSITLFDPDGNFNPNNSDNFWTEHWDRTDIPEHYNQVGYKGPVEIWIGYDNDGTIESEKIFEGEVTNIRVNLQPPEVIIEAVDASQNLRPAKVYDFGIPRKMVLPEDEDADTGYSRRYPFPPHSIPSERSVSAVTSVSKSAMKNVGTISTEGTGSPLNYQIADNAIETESGPLWDNNKPIATFKDVHRYKRIDTLLKNITDHYNVRNPDIDILPQQTEARHFASNGRPGWDIENLTTHFTRQWNWDGYIKDVIYDSANKKYYMLYGQQSHAHPDWLISYDVATDSWERVATTYIVIDGKRHEYEMWQLATDDFETFYILATVYRPEELGAWIPGVYDAWEVDTSEIRILKYVNDTPPTWSIVDDAGVNGNKPQIGFYYSAFFPPFVHLNRFPMLPDNRNSFVIATIAGNKELVYRGQSGIHTYRLSDGSKRLLKMIPKDSRRSMDFWIGDTPETTFFAWTVIDADNSTLCVHNGNNEEIVNIDYDVDENEFFRDVGKSEIITISDMFLHHDDLYAVLQIKAGTRLRNYSQGYLIKIDVSTCRVERVKHYPHFVRAARSPVIHKGTVYYFEGSHYQYQEHVSFINANNGVLTYNEPYPDNTGSLIKVDDDERTDLGLCWRSASQEASGEEGVDLGFGRHGGTASPMISDGENIHLWAGYGDLTKLNEPPANHVDNWHWLQYGKNLPQRVPTLHTNGKKAWDIMNELARLTNATISYRSGRFSFLPRLTRQTNLRLDLLETTTSHAAVVDAGRFPSSGMVLINDELISYSTKSADDSDIELLTRGAEKSQVTNHTKGDTVLFVDALVFNHSDKRNLSSLKFKPDFHGIYNQLTAKLTPIAGEKAEVSVQSDESIAANGEKPRDFNFDMLTWHERPWAEVLLDEYLIDMQQAQFEVELELPWAPHLKLGQTLVVDQQVVAHLRWTPVRILRISHDFDERTTRVTGRTFGLRRVSQTTLIFEGDVPDYTFIVNQQITPFTLPEAKGGLGTLAYSLSDLPPGTLSFDANTRAVSGTPTQTGTWLMTYTATDMTTPPQTAKLRFRITVVDALAFDGDTDHPLVFDERCHINHQLPATIGGIGRIFYELVGLPEPLVFDPNLRRILGIMPAGRWDLEYRARDSAESANEIADTFDIIGDSVPTWRAIIATEFTQNSEKSIEVMVLDGDSRTGRAFLEDGTRRLSSGSPNSYDIPLGSSGEWRGGTGTTNRKIFVNNSGDVKFFDHSNAEQTGEALSLGTGDWQDVALIGTDRLGFLDAGDRGEDNPRVSGAIRMYSTSGMRLAAEDIKFGFQAQFRSIAYFEDSSANKKIAVLIENLPTVLVWDMAAGALADDEAFDIIEGSTDWQSITRHPDGHFLLVRKRSARAIAITAAAARNKELDVLLHQ